MRADADEFAELFTDSYPVVVRFVFLRVNDHMIAEELAAEAFTIAWAKRGQAKISRSWLFAVAHNLIGNEYQRRDRERGRVHAVAMNELVRVEAWGTELQNIELRAAMARLRSADALVLQLTYWHCLSAREVAQFMDCTTASVWVRLTRARAALRALLDDPAPVRVEQPSLEGADG